VFALFRPGLRSGAIIRFFFLSTRLPAGLILIGSRRAGLSSFALRIQLVFFGLFRLKATIFSRGAGAGPVWLGLGHCGIRIAASTEDAIELLLNGRSHEVFA